LRRAIKGRPVSKQGLRILSMDGGGMKGLATVQMLKQIEQGTGKRIHELFDLICGTSTGGMLAIALTIKQMTLDQCEEIYKKLGKEYSTWHLEAVSCLYVFFLITDSPSHSYDSIPQENLCLLNLSQKTKLQLGERS